MATEDKSKQGKAHPVRCGESPPFPKSKQTKKPCRQWPLKGASRCKVHGGGSQLQSRAGIKPKGGPPIKHGLYARHLPSGMLDAFRAAHTDSLDQEIRLAKAKLDWAVQQWSDDPLGGVRKGETRDELGGLKSETWIPWTELVRAHAETVNRLTHTKWRHGKQDPGSKPMLTHKAWLKKRQGQRAPTPTKESTDEK